MAHPGELAFGRLFCTTGAFLLGAGLPALLAGAGVKGLSILGMAACAFLASIGYFGIFEVGYGTYLLVVTRRQMRRATAAMQKRCSLPATAVGLPEPGYWATSTRTRPQYRPMASIFDPARVNTPITTPSSPQLNEKSPPPEPGPGFTW